MSKPMTLAPDADAHPERCRIAGCVKRLHCRGFCVAHYSDALSKGLLDTLGLPSKRGKAKRAVIEPSSADLTPDDPAVVIPFRLTLSISCGSVQVFEVGGEPPTVTLIGDQDVIRAFARLGLYRVLSVYEVEAGLLVYAPKT